MNFKRRLPANVFLSAALLSLLQLFSSCNNNSMQKTDKPAPVKGTFAYDAAFLKEHTGESIELSSPDGSSKVLLSAKYQGRVMTSTAMGDSGTSFGWLNYDLIAAKEPKQQFNPVGGEERFWMGPEGGQFSIYFKKGDSFNIAHWQVPAFIDTNAYQYAPVAQDKASFSFDANFTNYSGTAFSVKINRTITLLGKEPLQKKLNAAISDSVHFVGFESENIITNTGKAAWTKETGLLSIWLLGMFTPGPKTTVIIPFHAIPNARQYITSNYFGEVPPERLHITDSVVYFTCDGKYRSKIGLSSRIAKPVAGAFDFEKNVLTILIPEVHRDAPYVNSKWELQQDPFSGDVINSYNDGPLADGSQMGPFLEIESSSPALALPSNMEGRYSQTTCHFMGSYAELRKLAITLLGVDLDSIGH